MKKLVFLIIFFSAFNSLFAALFKSNIMGQNLGRVKADSEYVLEENGRESVLKRKNVVIKKYTKTNEAGADVLTEENLERGIVVIKKYKGGLLLEEIIKTEKEVCTTVFNYADGKLRFSTLTREPNKDKSSLPKKNKVSVEKEKKDGLINNTEPVDAANSSKITETSRDTSGEADLLNSDLTSATETRDGLTVSLEQNSDTSETSVFTTLTTSDTESFDFTSGTVQFPDMSDTSFTSDTADAVGATNTDFDSDMLENTENKEESVDTDKEKSSEAVSITEYYIRNSATGALIGTRVFDSINFAGSTYLIEGDNLYKQYSDNLVYQDKDNLAFNEDGTFVIEENGISTTYSKRGDILFVKTQKDNTEYFYDESFNLVKREVVLNKKEKTEPDVKIVHNYKNGELESTVNYINDTIENIVRYPKETYGNIKTVYSSGSPLAEVYYDIDNVRIVKIEYL